MKIAPINATTYCQKTNFKGLEGKKAQVPFEVESPKLDNPYSYECHKEYEDNVLKALNERKDELYAYIDSIKDEDGLTFADKFAKMLGAENAEIEEGTFLHKTSYDNLESLRKNGFDPQKIGKVEYGPGFYTGRSEGSLEIYSGAVTNVKYKGNTTQARGLSKYGTTRSQIVEFLRDYLGLETDFSNPLMSDEYSAFYKFVNEYSRKTITDKLKIDGAHILENHGYGYFVIFNPDAIEEISLRD